jgi:VPDSG-CTERM motif
MKTISVKNVAAIAGLLLLGAESAFPITLGGFTFNDLQFGNTLAESDGGTFRNANFLNIVNANPGNPGALTGANFDTGIANIGFGGTPVYTIGYNTVIANNPGADLGIVSARFSSNDTFRLEVSPDGVNFTGALDFGPALAVDTGVGKTYFYQGLQFGAELFVTPVDLSAFIAPGATIAAVRVTSFPEGDLIRIAGLTTSVPDAGSTLTLLGSGLALLAGLRRRFIHA